MRILWLSMLYITQLDSHPIPSFAVCITTILFPRLSVVCNGFAEDGDHTFFKVGP